MTALVDVRGVSKHYGAFRALEDVSLKVGEGELVSIVGPNGAGKTTLVNLITGLLKPTSGQVLFKGVDIGGRGPVRLAEAGMARAFQLVQVFPEMTVGETIGTAVVSRRRKRWQMLASVRGDAATQDEIEGIARIFGLERRINTPARDLSQGEKKLLDVASAFALRPDVILLDEPTSGVSTAEKHGMMETLIAAAKSAGVKSIILVEHDMDLVAEYSTRIVALTAGKVLADRAPQAFFSDPAILSRA